MSDFSKRYEKLPVTIFSASEEAAVITANKVLQHIVQNKNQGKHTVLACSASSALIQTYEELVNLYRENKLSFKDVHIFVVDEYYPIDHNDLQSHYRFLKEYLFDNIDIPASHLHCPDGSLAKADVYAFCQDYEAQIAALGGIDLLLTGGMGFNEPGSSLHSQTRLITLNYSSRVSAASEFFGVEYVPHHAITMGLETILGAKDIYYLA